MGVNRRHGTDTSVIRLTWYYHGKAGLMFTLSDLHATPCHDRWKAVFWEGTGCTDSFFLL